MIETALLIEIALFHDTWLKQGISVHHQKKIGNTFTETHSQKHIWKHIHRNTFQFLILSNFILNQMKELQKCYSPKNHCKM